MRNDWARYSDGAAANPAKVQEMTKLMFAEFARYQVLPLDASVATRLVTPRPSVSGGRTVFTYTGDPVTGMPRGTAPSLLNTSYTITAEIEIPGGGEPGRLALSPSQAKVGSVMHAGMASASLRPIPKLPKQKAPGRFLRRTNGSSQTSV